MDEDAIYFGKLVTVWTGYVAEYSTSAALSIPMVPMIVTVHPAQNSTSCIKYHSERPGYPLLTRCRRPLESVQSSQSAPLPHLVTLKEYLVTNHDGTLGTRVLVCIRSIGPRKPVQTRDLGMRNIINVTVFDETVTSCLLNLWGEQGLASHGWIPGETILLLTNPKVKTNGNAMAELSIGVKSIVDVDPACSESNWLRNMALGKKRKEVVYTPFPTNIFDPAVIKVSENRTLFTIADVDEYARDDPDTLVTGKLSVLILGVALVEYSQRIMLCCYEW